MPAAGPAARSALAFLQFFLRPADPPFSGLLLLRVLDPTDELIAAQRSAVLPQFQRSRVGQQRRTQIRGKLVHDPAGHQGAHEPRLARGASPNRPAATFTKSTMRRPTSSGC